MPWRTTLGRYGVAVLAMAAALALRIALDPWLGQSQRLEFFYAAVALAVWYAGPAPALMAAALGLPVADYFFVAPRHALGPSDPPAAASLLMYTSTCGLIVLAGALARRRRERTEAYAQALRTSEAQLRAVLDQASAGFAMTDLTGRFLRVNVCYCEIVGRSAQDLLGMRIQDITHPEDLVRNGPLFERLVAGGSSFRIEKRYVRPDGSTVWVGSEVYSLRGADGSPEAVIAVSLDITARRRTEAELAYQRELLATITENAQTAILLMDPQGRGLFANPAVQAITGYAPEELLGQVLHEKVHHSRPDGRPYPRVECPLDRALPLEQSVRAHEDVFVRKDGSFFPVRCNAKPVLREGRPVATVIEVWDITREKAAEQSLRDRELRMRLALEASGAAMWTVDYTRDGRESFDARSCELAGLDPSRADWPAGTLCGLLHPEDQPRMQAAAEATRATAGRGPLIEYRIVRSDGQVRWLQGAGIVQRDAQGRPLQFIGVSIDITERKRLEGELRETVAKLAEADRRKDEFLATLAHELRNPLAPIRNAVHFMELKGPADPALRNAREIIERQVRHLTHLVDDLLDLSRITRGQIKLQEERLDLEMAVLAAIEACQPQIDAAGHDLVVNLPAQPLYVEGDLTRLSQVIANLLSNAARYTPPGGRIELSAEARGREALLSVKDSGVGIAPEMLERIFEMFTQVDGSAGRGQGGLGIGLALARQLVQLHGGRIEARSEGPGRGSTFTVQLPLASSSAARTPIRAAGPASAGEPRRVLVADDNVDAAESLAMLLQTLGHEVRTAHDGLQALEAAREFRPAIVLLDIGMPRLNGYEAARRIRALPGGEKMLIVALTGWGQDEDKRRAAEAGFDEHLTKPVDPALLTTVIKAHTAPA